jgi:aspartyl-tRNA(Asn)/glutamyl-tRNA(Gln) amidotransferase subunit A
MATLAAAGAEVFDLPEDLLDFEAILRDHSTIMCSECAAGHQERFAAERGDYAPRISALIEEGLATSAPAYVRARSDRDPTRSKLGDWLWSETVDELLLVMPATIGPAPDVTSTGDPAFNSPWSFLGLTAISLPIGVTPDGLPLALQLVDGREGFGSRPLLNTAAWCEDVLRRAQRARTRSE